MLKLSAFRRLAFFLPLLLWGMTALAVPDPSPQLSFMFPGEEERWLQPDTEGLWLFDRRQEHPRLVRRGVLTGGQINPTVETYGIDLVEAPMTRVPRGSEIAFFAFKDGLFAFNRSGQALQLLSTSPREALTSADFKTLPEIVSYETGRRIQVIGVRPSAESATIIAVDTGLEKSHSHTVTSTDPRSFQRYGARTLKTSSGEVLALDISGRQQKSTGFMFLRDWPGENAFLKFQRQTPQVKFEVVIANQGLRYFSVLPAPPGPVAVAQQWAASSAYSKLTRDFESSGAAASTPIEESAVAGLYASLPPVEQSGNPPGILLYDSASADADLQTAEREIQDLARLNNLHALYLVVRSLSRWSLVYSPVGKGAGLGQALNACNLGYKPLPGH